MRDDGSVMYNVGFSKLEQYDWHQFAIMLARILEGSEDEYHKRLPVFEKDDCGKELQRSCCEGVKPNALVLKCDMGQQQKTLDDMF